MRPHASLYGIVATMLSFGHAIPAIGGDLDPSGRLALDRMVSGAVNSVEPAGKIVGDVYIDYQKTRKSDSPGQTTVALAAGQYNRAFAQNGLELNVYRGASLIRDTALSAGGPVGVAAAGVFRVSLDRMVEGIYEKRNAASRTVLRGAVQTFNDNELNELVKEAQSGRVSDRFRKSVRSVVDSSGQLDDEKAKDLVVEEVTLLTAKMSEVQIRQLADIARQQATTNQEVKVSVGKLTELDKQTEDLKREMHAVEIQSGQAANQVDELFFKELDTDKEREEYLRRGGLSHIDQTARQELLDRVTVGAQFELVQGSLSNTAAGLQSLSIFVGNVLGDSHAAATISQVASGVQAAQAVISIVALFSGVGAPMAAFSAFGSLSSMFGGGGPMGGSQPELQAIQATLGEMNKKLDRMLEMQQQTLQSLNDIHDQLEVLRSDVRSLNETTQQGFANLLAGQWKGVYSDCNRLLARLQGGGGGGFDLPYKTRDAYRKAHFLNGDRLSLLSSADGRSCSTGLRGLGRQPRSILDLSYKDLANESERAAVATATTNLQEARGALASSLASRIADHSELATAFTSAMLHMTRPANSVQEAQERVEAVNGKPVAEDDLPCWWRVVPEKAKCGWATVRQQVDGTDIYRNILDGDRLLHPWAVAELVDYTLSFYPQILLPRSAKVVSDPNGRVSPNKLSQHLNREYSAVEQELRDLLTDYLQVNDIAVAQQAISEGDLLAALLARDLLDPPIGYLSGQGPFGTNLRQGLPPACLSKWANRPAGVAAATNLYLRDHPRTAQIVLLLVLRRSVFPSRADSSLNRGPQYEFSRLSEPSGRLFDATMGRRSPIVTDSDIDAAWKTWWEGTFDLGVIKVDDKEHVHRGYELHYAAVEGETAELWVPVKRARKIEDRDEDVCEKYDSDGDVVLEKGRVNLPRGWSISAGGLVMGLPAATALRIAPMPRGRELEVLVTRQSSLREELLTVATKPDIAGIEALLAYGLGQQARVALGVEDRAATNTKQRRQSK